MTEKHTAHSVVDWTGYLYHEEVDALKELTAALPKNAHIINIGAGNGTSGLAFMEARPDVRVTTIDIQLESSPFGCLAGEEAVFRSAGFWGDPRHEQIHGDSKVVGAHWRETREMVDLVFVDGGHQEHEAWGDISIWRANLKPGGVLVVHDYEKSEKIWPGVDRAVRRAIKAYGDPIIMQVKTLIAFRIPETTPPAKPAPNHRTPRKPRVKKGDAS